MTDLRARLQASLGNAYAVERELGGGGMSHVFVAEELTLGRRVVVKVLPDELAAGVSHERFRREISLAARLQHPHIVPLLSAGEIDGLPYYMMPFVDGETLRARVARGELPIGETISILRDVARALEFAHSKGIAHRDVKPDNVLLAGTSAVITDFGVAKALSDAALGGPLTSIGIALGTPAYMAPEQAAADPTTDARADIYAFGAMAYEMLAGHQPFAGRTTQGVMAAHATEAPTPIGTIRRAAPLPLANLVMQCLEKRPGDRPQTATAILQALESAAAASGATTPPSGALASAQTSQQRAVSRILIAGIAVAAVAVATVLWWRTRNANPSGGAVRSIAVVPFENKSGDSTFDYLEDGITDHVRDALNVLPGIAVKARGSSRQLKGRATRDIGSKLGVGIIVQGAVSGSASHLHVTAELVRVSDDAALWSGTFDGPANQLAGIQDTIVRAIIGKLHLTRGDDAQARAARGTNDVEAYDRFLKAFHAFDANDFATAVPLFKEAIARDPNYARAHAFLAQTYAAMPTLGIAAPDSMNRLALASARTALALDPSLADARAVEALVLGNELRFGASLAPLEAAIALDSTNAGLLAVYGQTLGQIGRIADGLVQARRARDRDPYSGTAVGLLSYAYYLAGDYDAAITQMRAALEIDPANPIMFRALGFFYAFKGAPDSAVKAFETAFKLGPTIFGGRSNLVFAYAVAGRWDDASRQRALAERENAGNSPNYYRMMSSLSFGENDAAMTALERGVAAHESLFITVSVACDRVFDPLKADPRFDALMRRMGAHACPATAKWPISPRARAE